jgi:hypothetical protein
MWRSEESWAADLQIGSSPACTLYFIKSWRVKHKITHFRKLYRYIGITPGAYTYVPYRIAFAASAMGSILRTVCILMENNSFTKEDKTILNIYAGTQVGQYLPNLQNMKEFFN